MIYEHNLIPVGFGATTPANVDSSITEEWARRVLREHLVRGFFGPLVGPEGSGKPIIQKTELLNKPGDTIHIQTTAPLTGSGVTGDTTRIRTELGGAGEENLTTSAITVVPEFYRHAVAWFRRANKKSILDLREEARMRLREWGAEKMDDVRFALFTQTANLNGAAYAANTFALGSGGYSGVPNDVASGDDFDVISLQKVKLALVNQKARPIRVAGVPYYGLVMHPNCAFNLKQDSRYEQWVREAMRRGESNPLFTGALAVIDGMILYEHPNVPVAANGTAIDVAHNIAFGSEAFVEGVDENPSWAEDSFDYDNEFGVAYSFGFQPRRALAMNSLLVYADATDPLA